MGDIKIMEEFKENNKPGFTFSEKILIDLEKYNTVEKIFKKIQKTQKIVSIIIGIKVEKNVPTNKINSLSIICSGDKLYKNIFVLILSKEIEGEKTDKIINGYKFTDKFVIENNFKMVVNEKVKRIFQYQESKELKPVPIK